jgi:glycosyltransferase involved in cell wall biosynthesis
MFKVSAVIITCNEEHNLCQLLPQLVWCDEIIIVDSGSTDKTLDVCRYYNCKIYYREFEGYGPQKRYALSLAENDWILSLDADEILSDELIAEIRNEMNSPSADGYYIPMVFVFMGKEFRYGKENWKYFLRLFNRKRGDFSADRVHEQILVDGCCKKLSGNIYHYSYRTFAQYFEKFNRYSTLAAEAAYARGKKRSLLAVLFALPLSFLKYYLLEGNFMNGLNGFYWSVLSSFYQFIKYIKLREMYARTRSLQT